MLPLGGDDQFIVNIMLTCLELCNSLVQHKESSSGIIIYYLCNLIKVQVKTKNAPPHW